jgi:hypothetical protein
MFIIQSWWQFSAARKGRIDITNSCKIHTISRYLKNDEHTMQQLDELLIPESEFEKDWSQDLPIISALDCVTHCFTAAYGRQLHRAAGSLLLMGPARSMSVADMAIDR